MPTPILSVAEMRAWEARTWQAGVAVEDVIRRAGEALARHARRWIPAGASVLVLAGPGHNGDDAVVAAAHLPDRSVTVVRLDGSAAQATALEWLGRRNGGAGRWVVDGMFGIGLSRPIEGPWAQLVRSILDAGVRVLSVDVPSGLDADTGEVRGVAVRADITVTLGAVKRGLLRESAAEWVGRLELAGDIGLLGEPGTEGGVPGWWDEGDVRDYPPPRPASGHKGTFGHVGVVAGSLGYHGAAVLAAQGASRARPGLVTLLTDARSYVPAASQLRAAMVRPVTVEGEGLETSGFTALVLGPGLAARDLGRAWRAFVQRAWTEFPGPVVVDASALDWLEPGRPGVSTEAGVFGPARVRVVTPHPGEASRLLGCSVAEVQSDRLGAVARLGGWFGEAGAGGVVVLKGRHTLVRDAVGGVTVNGTGNPGLAQGGSGDVLAGYLGGLLAQPRLAEDPTRAVRYGVWRHGAVADELEASGRAWTPEDLVAALGEAR